MKKSIFFIFFIGLVSLFYGCGNSNSHTKKNISHEQNISEDISHEYNISGVIQKGNFINGILTAQRVEVNGSTLEEVVSVSIDKDARYKLTLPWKGLTLLSAKGKFFNEYTGKNSTEDAQLYALVDIGDSLSQDININLFTSLETYRVIELMKEGKSYTKALSLAKSSLEAIVGLPQKINANKLNIYDINGTLKDENKNLLLFSGTLLKILDSNLTTNSSQQKLIQKFSLSKMKKFYKDFGDNGKIDGVAKDIYQNIVQDDKKSTWNRIIDRLGLGDIKFDNNHNWSNITSNNDINLTPINRDDIGVVDNFIPIGNSRTEFRIIKFSLKSVTLNGKKYQYTNQSAFFLKDPANSEKLTFYLERNSVAQKYKVDIYAISGSKSLLVRKNINIARNAIGLNIDIYIDDKLREFIKNAKSDDIKFRVVSNIFLNNIAFVSKTSDVMPKFIGLSDKLKVNNTLVNIRHARYIGQLNSSCEETTSQFDDSTTQYAEFDMNINWRPSPLWNDVNGSISNACMQLDYDSDTNSYIPTLKNKKIKLITSLYRDYFGILFDSKDMDIYINPNGNFEGNSLLRFPLSTSMHYQFTINGIKFPISPEAQKYFLVSLAQSNISDNWDDISIKFKQQLDENSSVTPYIHSNSLPFYINLKKASVKFNSYGLKITNASAKYIHEGDINRISSNDILFSNPTADTFNITIDENGLQTDTPIHFGWLTNAKTDFPFTKISAQNGFNINIVNGKIVPIDITNNRTYSLTYSSKCKEASCSQGGNSIQSISFNSPKTYISQDGAFVSDISIDNKMVAWGMKKNSKFIFERKSDKKGKMYVPGFAIKANTPKTLISTLLGSRDINSSGKLSDVYTLKDEFTKKGNGVFAGLNVGSLYLDRNDTSDASLAGTNMDVQVAGVGLNLTNNNKTKYYIRPSGITGVFNGSLQQVNEALSIYGYPMTFKSFAFSQVANKLNTKTLIDGKISVIGNGGFGVDFSSLALDCTGGLNRGVVDESDCEASPTINCGQTLTQWKTKTQFVSVEFESDAQNVCDDKTLKIGHVLDIKALTKPLGLTTNWTSEGNPQNAKVTGSSSNYLDRAETNSSSRGFSITLDSGADLTSKGWYKFAGDFGLPFWGMKPVDLGLANKTENSRDLSRVMPRNKLDQTTYESNKPQKFMVSYEWGSTGFGFELPVVYNAKEADKESIFIGKKLEIDLGVMSANAGINYIKPQNTKISFGASADFERMGKLQIKVDLNDPESIKKIDDTLDTFGIDGNPMSSTIGLILDPLHKIEEYADKGLFLSMEELGVKALKKGTDEVGIDPFEEASDTFIKIHSLPIQAIDMTEDYIIEQLDSKLNEALRLVDELNNNLNSNEIETKKEEAIKQLDMVLDNFYVLDRLNNQLGDINKTLNSINITETWNRVDTKISAILGQDSTECSNNINHSELFKPIITLENNISYVNNQLQETKTLNKVKGFASKVEKYIDFDSNDLVNVFEKTQRVANSLTDEIASANSSIDEALQIFCTEVNSTQESIKELILKVNEFNDIRTQLQNYIQVVRANLASDKLKTIRGKIETLKKSIEDNNFTVEINSNYILSSIENSINLNSLKDSLQQIPQPTANELREMVITKILDTDAMKKIRVAMNDSFSPVMDEVREVVVELFSSVNRVVYDIFGKLSKKANEALASATSSIKSLPIKSGKMDGYALISGDELDRIHIGAEWKVDSGNKDTSYSFNGALDMQRWGASGKAGCGGDTSTDSNIDVKISTRDIKLSLGRKKLSIDELYFGFALAKAIPVGVMGGIESKLGFEFNKFYLFDMKLFVGIGAIETYLGAKSSAIFDKYQMNVALLLGKTCGKEIITSLDPKVGDFITLPNNVFKGVYIRGGASFPIWNNGCALTVGVTADLGVWVLIPGTYGGLVGGGAYGKALCIASLKGKVQTIFEKSGDNIKFQGEGWGAAGAGWCSPSKWYSVAKSRRDSWCGTGDAQFGAKYDNGWELLDIDTDAVF